ncbi:DUF4397 domain-containing protein [Myxococcaceae bacterium JPH2]|nr:DUF4397 domain-containing protein [Myxococcaceae bacterium JPH2]
MPKPPESVDAGHGDAGSPDAGGVDASTPDAGTVDAGLGDGGVDAGTCADGGVPGADGGCGGGVPSARALVRFVHVFSGLRSGTADNAAWEPFRVDVYADDVKVFSAVKPGDSAVTVYASVEIPAAGGTVRFTLRDADAVASAEPLATTTAELHAGQHLTLVGAGLLPAGAPDASDRPRALALTEAFGAVDSGRVRVRFVSADFVAGPVDSDNRNFTDELGATVYATTNPYGVDSTPEGKSLPSTLTRLAVSGEPTFIPSQSGKLFFSLRDGALVAGASYFAVLTGNVARSLADEGAPSLLWIRAGEDGFVRVKRDPLVYFFNAVLPATGSAAPRLSALRSGAVVANDFRYGQLPKVAELPAASTGLALSVVLSGGSTTVVPETQTGPLEAGRRYLAVVSGRQEASPRLTLIPESFEPEPLARPLVRFVNASPTVPEPLDFGYYALASDGTSRGAFTPVFSGAAYASVTGPAAGAAFEPPVVTPAAGAPFSYFGIKSAAGTTPFERYATGARPVAPSFVVLLGDADATSGSLVLQHRLINTRTPQWATSAAQAGYVAP